MSNETIQSIDRWFEKAHGEARLKKRTVQLGVHFEEVREMLEALRSKDPTAEQLMQEAGAALDNLACFLKKNSATVVIQADDNLLLDSLCDQIVTAVGVGYDFGYNTPKAIVEVNRSNYSKFVNGQPVFDENGKVKKGPDYTPPNLTNYIG